MATRKIKALEGTDEVRPVLNSVAAKGVKISNPPEVRRYLKKYPQLLGRLEDAVDEVRKLDVGAPMLLERTRDPETDDLTLFLFLPKRNVKETLRFDLAEQVNARVGKKHGPMSLGSWFQAAADLRVAE